MRRIIPLLLLAILATLAVVFVAGCKSPFGTTNISHKTVHVHPNAVNLHPIPGSVGDAVDGTENGTEFIQPDGSFVSLTGGGMVGNLILSIMLNDDTGQTTKTDAKASAQANVKSDDASIVTDDTNVEEPVE